MLLLLSFLPRFVITRSFFSPVPPFGVVCTVSVFGEASRFVAAKKGSSRCPCSIQIDFLLYNSVNLLQDNKIQFLASFNFLNKEVRRLPYNPTKRGRFAELRTPEYTLRRTGVSLSDMKHPGFSNHLLVFT